MDIFYTAVNASISTIFALVALRQYLQRRKTFQFVWLIGLMIFAVSANCELALTITQQWTAPLYIVWYLTGAMLGGVFFGQGTVYFLAPRRWADVSMVMVLVFSVYGIYLALTVPLNLAAIDPAIPSGDGFPSIRAAGFGTPRWLTPLLNIYGFIWLNGGALYSAVQLARKRMEKYRVLANVLIAAGGTTIAFVSTLNRFGRHEFQYVGEALGIVLMFSGFMLSTRSSQVETPAQDLATATPSLES